MMDKKFEEAFRKKANSEMDTDDEWHVIEEAPAGQSAEGLKHKWEELAIDVALIPEMNVRLVTSEKGERIEISDTMYSYFFQK